MGIELDHPIITMKNGDEATSFYANILGLKYEGKMDDFSIMQVTDSLTLDKGLSVDTSHSRCPLMSLRQASHGSNNLGFPTVKGQEGPKTCVALG